MQIHAVSEPAITSAILQLDVPEDAGAVVVAMEPSPLPDSTDKPTVTFAPTLTATEETITKNLVTKPSFLDWLLAIITIVGGSYIAYLIGYRVYSLRWGLRWGLCTILAGLLCYLYIALDLPGGLIWLNTAGTSGLIFGILLFMGLGWIVGFLWHTFSVQQITGSLR